MSNGSDVSELQERIAELEERVSYLEVELDTSLDRAKFEDFADRLFKESSPDEIRDNGVGGYFARASGLSVEDANQAIGRLEGGPRDDVEWALTETGDGLGLEVWTL